MAIPSISAPWEDIYDKESQFKTDPEDGDPLQKLVKDLEFLQYENSIEQVKPSLFDFRSDADSSDPCALSEFGLNIVTQSLHIGLLNDDTSTVPWHRNRILLLVWPSFVSSLAYENRKSYLPGIKKIKTMVFRVSEVVFLRYLGYNLSTDGIIAATAILSPAEEWRLLERMVISSFYNLVFDKPITDSYGSSDIWKNYPRESLDLAWKQLLLICCGPQSVAYVIKRMLKRNWARLGRIAVDTGVDHKNTDYVVFSDGDMISLLIQWSKFSFKYEAILSCLTELNSKKPILEPKDAVDMVKSSFATVVLLSKVFRCQICDYETNHKSNYSTHSRIHTGEKPYSCKICMKDFSDPACLRVHNIYHNRCYKSRCKFCGKEFAKAWYLKVHMVNNHDSESLYQCFSCKLFFVSEVDLASHMPSHADDLKFECSQCPRRFATESRLVEHSLTHSLDKPFKCDICGTGFLRKTDLRRHIVQHSGSRFDCDFCRKSFKRNDHRYTHQRVMHEKAQSAQ